MADLNSCCDPTGFFTDDPLRPSPASARYPICYTTGDPALPPVSGYLELTFDTDTGQATGSQILDSALDPVVGATQVECPRDCFGDPVSVPPGIAPL